MGPSSRRRLKQRLAANPSLSLLQNKSETLATLQPLATYAQVFIVDTHIYIHFHAIVVVAVVIITTIRAILKFITLLDCSAAL